MSRCTACATLSGETEVPGGVVWEDESWVADHCLGPFGVGALVLKARAHRESLPELTDAEARALGPALRTVSAAMVAGLPCERVYVSAWVDQPPLHVHLVIEPRYAEEAGIGAWELQARRRAGEPPAADDAAAAAERVRRALIVELGAP
ncbi:MAG: diadenosine tetraphosphate hydrolase [Solirubrobacterales bacterium]|nr:diadenosine tetraphosphate hydrolase [Solirubrobacterales bacterium]